MMKTTREHGMYCAPCNVLHTEEWVNQPDGTREEACYWCGSKMAPAFIETITTHNHRLVQLRA